MEEVRFEDYEGRERKTERFFHDEKQREELPFLAKAGIGAAAIAGLLTAGHRTGAIRKIVRYMDTEGKATLQAAKEVMDNQGKLFTGQDKLTIDRMKILKESFKERREANLKIYKRPENEILLQREFGLQRELRKMDELVGEYKSPRHKDNRGEMGYHIEESFRHAAIFDDIRKSSKLSNQPNVVDELEKAVSKGNLGILDYGGDEQLNLLLKQHGKGVGNSEVLEVLKEARSKYKGKSMFAENADAERTLKEMQEKVKEVSYGYMKEHFEKHYTNKKFKDVMIGHKQATADDVLALHKEGRIRMNEDLIYKINEAKKYDEGFGDVIFDKDLYLLTKDGKASGLMDYGTLSKGKRNTADWWANTIPGGLIHLRDILNIKEARENAGVRIFQRGSILSSLNAHRGFEATEALNEEVVFMYGKFVKLNDVDAINNNNALEVLNKNRNMYLTSSQFGTTGKMHRHMSGLMTDNETPRNIAGEIMDIGRQDKDDFFTQSVSMLTKFGKKDWERNRIKGAIKNGIDTPEDYFAMRTYFKLNTEGFSPRFLNAVKDDLSPQVKQFIDENDINFSLDEDINKLFQHIGKEALDKKSTNSELTTLYRQFERNPERVLTRQTPIGESSPILGHHTRMQTGQDVIKQHVSMHLMKDMLLKRGGDDQRKALPELLSGFRQEVKGLHHDGKITTDDRQKAESLINYTMFQGISEDIYKNVNPTLNRVSKLFQEDQDFQESMRIMSRKTNPIWERFSEIRPENKVNDQYIAVNEANLGGVFNKMIGLNSDLKDRAAAAGDLFKQLNPFTGRRNLEDVTTATLFGNYYPVYRLQDALGNVKLGLSDQSMGNSAQMLAAIMLKRILPVYAGVEGIKYADYKVDQWTGEGLDERWENYKANARLDNAAGRTELDIYESQRERMLKPGIEHWEAMPEIHIPGLGPISAGDGLNAISGMLGFGYAPLREEELMTYDQTMEDLYYGTEEIRKSRYWFMGSKSAFRGDRVIEFAPNSFRMAHSDHEWTNTSATGEEYWGNHILPTLENPLGGLSFALGLKDPYWYERKHYYDRPYMLTGELFNPNTMILGDIGNATIGRLVKPVKEMHPEYWGDPLLIYEEETQDLGQRPDGPIRTEVSPAGRVTHDISATPEEYGATRIVAVEGEINQDALATIESHRGESRYIASPELDPSTGEATGAYVAKDMESNQSMYVPANIAKENISIDKLFKMAEEPAPQGSEVKGVYLTNQAPNPSYNVQVSTQPRGMFDEEYAYRQDIMYRKMMNIKDPRDGSWRLQEGIENWTEPLGVYKWILQDEVLGHDPYSGNMVVQRADAATNVSNRFWESELGSLGMDLSEIGRRFIRRDDGQLDKYNPIRNTMPDWMPGEDYFINFQTGDPYSKLPRGEYRLPGEAYESLNELHPDETGRYGAFDKFKILADAAPFSEEYNFWSQYLLDNLEEGSDLRKQATAIRKQVSERRKKYDFQPYRFKGNDIVYQDITVDRFLDDYTFLSKELGDTPIRLAGMEYRKKATGVLQNYFKEGDKVTIGIAEDENKRISNDTYGTMRAVVFNKLGNINKDIIERASMVENQNDFSAAGIHARFTSQEISKGSKWESLAHASSPLNTKFLQVRTALEEYERDQVYGKDFATWENFMLDDYIVPTLQGIGRYDSPLYSGLAGAVTGGVLGRFFLKGGKTTKAAIYAGALFGLGSNAFYKNYEKKHGEKWVPERRRTENDLNEYFDILKFLKYEGLYQKAREEIVHATGHDVEDFARIIDEQKGLTKERRKELEAEKKQLYLEQPKGWEERKKEINTELNAISEDKGSLYLPDSFLEALNYKKERDTTLYAVDPFGDRMDVMSAFPYKDKWFFSEFVEASDEEREKILKLVPENQRRIYKAMWGYEVEDQKPLEYYMQKYDIPDWTWEGWRPEYSLEDVKVKAVQEAGLDLSDFNFWDDDVQASQYVPDLQPTGNDFEGQQASNFDGFNALRQNLSSILQGQGLRDVQVVVKPSLGSETQVDLSYKEDRSEEIQEHLRMYGDRYV